MPAPFIRKAITSSQPCPMIWIARLPTSYRIKICGGKLTSTATSHLRLAYQPLRISSTSWQSRVVTLEMNLPGMKIPGIVTNVTAFGAFVDIGVHQDGLVHISELADKFVKNPADVVRVQQKVEVAVMDVDLNRNRISLSMKTFPGQSIKKMTPSVKPPKRPSPAPSARKKKAPFNNPFADLLDRKSNS